MQKKLCRLYKNYLITCSHMTSHAIRVDEITGVTISIKMIKKD